jgi:Tfp pilus assembly protein PilO
MNILELLKLEDKISYEELESKLDVFRKYQQYFYISIILIVIVQFIFSYLIPSVERLDKESIMLGKFEKILKTRKKQTVNKEEIRQEVDRLNSELEEKKRVFFTLKEVDELSISKLPQLAELNNIKVNSTSFSKSTEKGKGVKTHDIKLNLTCGFKDLMNFFYSIENFPKTIKVNTVQINRKSVKPLVLNIIVTLQLFSMTDAGS